MPEQESYQDTYQNPITETWVKIRDLEDRQKLLRDRILLVGKNMIESKQESDSTLIELKKDIETLKQETEKIKQILFSISEELSNTAKKSELISLENQYKMFSPLELVRIKDVENLIEKKLRK